MMMECQVDKNEHFDTDFSSFNQSSKAAQDICSAYGEDAITGRTAQKWFLCFTFFGRFPTLCEAFCFTKMGS